MLIGDKWHPIKSNEPYWDPFLGTPPPPGIAFPLCDPIRKLESEEFSLRKGDCRCRRGDEETEPCRGGEWIRVFCRHCKVTLRIEASR